MDKFDEINEDEVFATKESRKININKKIIIPIIVALIIVGVIVFEVMTGTIRGLFSGMGNTVGNITNCGYSVEKGNYIYYVAPSEDMETANIHKLKKGTTDYEIIYQGNYDIRGLNVSGNKIYFIDITVTSNEGDIDNKMYKMNLDGSGLTLINDNEFAYDFSDIYVVKNKIYYVGKDYNVYKMDTNGGNRELVAETDAGFLAMNEKYIIYNKANEDDTDYITYIRSINGSDEKAITGSRINTPDIYNEYIYYVNENHALARISINNGEEEIINEGPIYNLNISNGICYYLNYKDEENEDYSVCIYKQNINGGEPEIIKEFSYYSSFINVIDGYIYYMDMDEEKAFINLIDITGENEWRLYEWKYPSEAMISENTENEKNISTDIEIVE